MLNIFKTINQPKRKKKTLRRINLSIFLLLIYLVGTSFSFIRSIKKSRTFVSSKKNFGIIIKVIVKVIAKAFFQLALILLLKKKVVKRISLI